MPNTHHPFKVGEIFRVRIPLRAPLYGSYEGLEGRLQVRTAERNRLIADAAGAVSFNDDGSVVVVFEISGDVTLLWAPGAYKWDAKLQSPTWGPHITNPTCTFTAELPATQS